MCIGKELHDFLTLPAQVGGWVPGAPWPRGGLGSLASPAEWVWASPTPAVWCVPCRPIKASTQRGADMRRWPPCAACRFLLQDIIIAMGK